MRMVPLTVRFGDEELLDYDEITPTRFYERLAIASEPPRTAAPPPERFTACYRELLEGRTRHVLSLHLSEALSATVSSARLAARRIGGAVTVVDSGSVSIGLRSARSASRASSRGARRSRRPRRRRRAVPALAPACSRSRRSSSCSATGASAGPGARRRPARRAAAAHPRRGRGRAARARARCTRACSAELERLLRGHARPTSRCASASPTRRPRSIAEALASAVRSARPQAVIELVAPLGAVVGTNTGPGGAGLVWAREPG